MDFGNLVGRRLSFTLSCDGRSPMCKDSKLKYSYYTKKTPINQHMAAQIKYSLPTPF